MSSIDQDNLICGGICNSYTESFSAAQTITEADQAVTEANQTITEVDQTITEANVAISELLMSEFLTDNWVGSPLAGVNTPADLPLTDLPFRLRMLISDNKSVTASSITMKLQYSPMVGTCDTAFTGESYVDMSSSTAMSFYDNTVASDGTMIHANDYDATSGTYNNTGQSYEESNNITNPLAMNSGDYVWDLSIAPNMAYGNTYCFRMVYSTGTLLNSYDYIPQVTIPASAGQFMRHGKYFDVNAARQSYYW